MKRISMLGLSAVLVFGIASISDNAFAQQRVTKDQLLGAWTFVSCMRADGSTPAICNNLNGRMVLEPTGLYVMAQIPRGRPKCTGACGRAQMSGDQWKAIAQDVFSQFGPWSFDEKDQILTVTPEAALNTNIEGREAKWKVSLTGDELRVTIMGADGARTDIYRRVR